MFWAHDPTGNLIKAEPGGLGFCPVCQDIVIAKCGTIYLWHWAHCQKNTTRQGKDCDSWSEPESQWHFDWKDKVPQHMREYVIKRKCEQSDGTFIEKIHRADILNSRGTVIELQHSAISEDEIRERERFYENMIWIFDFHKAKNQLFCQERTYDGFRYVWKYPRRTLLACKAPLFFDFNDQNINGPTTNHKIFKVSRISQAKPCYLEGSFVDYKTFLSMFFR